MRAEIGLAVCVAALAGFFVRETWETRVPADARALPAAAAIADGVLAPSADRLSKPRRARGSRGSGAGASATGTDPGTLRRSLRDFAASDGAPVTYIDDILRSRDSALVRWPDRRTRPLRVFIASGGEVPGWHADFVSAVRDAFVTWTSVGIPVHFLFVTDSASADIRVRFVESFSNAISGKTVWSRDAAWWLVNGDIVLAVAHPAGGAFTPPQMRAIALHEVGHVIGLDHSSNGDDIMASRIHVRDLTDADRATARLIYSVPAGTLKLR
jgi:hypothetical protein